jgi:alkanesulfonate monooxygenase SsuD/methylene tetrahydromethanopterin reductase-like flavin-dependent oxidoreductase (luciferase family)
MVKEFAWFTELAYSTRMDATLEQAIRKDGLRLSNSYFKPQQAFELYRMFFDEYAYANELGMDVMSNEHHPTPHCMFNLVNIITTHLISVAPKGRIIMLGTPLPRFDDPLRVAEEIATMDVLSGGRIVSGFIRGEPSEVNPTYNRERFDEAYQLVVKAWTVPGPFRFEGKHYQSMVINPWVLPMQKPHPPVWIPGISSPETVRWAAQHKLPYIHLGTDLDGSDDARQTYLQAATEVGWTPRDNTWFGAIIRVLVADTDEQAYEEGKHWHWLGGTRPFEPRTARPGYGRSPGFGSPPWYSSREARVAPQRAAGTALSLTDYKAANDTLSIITGNPKTVIKKLKTLVDRLDPFFLALWGREGPMSTEVAKRSIELLAQEVIPAMREHVPDTAAAQASKRSPRPKGLNPVL